jgi:hypothetical protein
MELIAQFRKSAGGRYAVTVMWAPPAGDPLGSVDISASGCTVPTEGDYAPLTEGNTTVLYVEGGLPNTIARIELTPESVGGIREPGVILLEYV